MKTIKYVISVGTCCFILAASFEARAGDNSGSDPNSFLPALSTVALAELPAKAAALVSHADPKAVQQTTIGVVKAAVGLDPAAAPAIVFSIAHLSPGMAATAATTAVFLVPNQSASIARAAAIAVPSQAGKIVEAICRVLPADYKKVANAVAEEVPGAGKDILTGVSAAIPQLKDTISQVLAENNGKQSPSVSEMLNQIAEIAGADNLRNTPVFPIDLGSGGEIPAGGRNYASP